MSNAQQKTLQEVIFADGASYFQSLLNDIAKAQKTIDLETYIYHPDTLGEKVASALTHAAKRGVQIRVLVDGAGTPTWGDSLTKKLDKAGILSRVFHPFPWRLWHWGRSVIRVPFILKWLYLCLKINSRNHRKVCIIDHKIAYVGSFNISQCHLAKEEGGDGWRDTAVKLIGLNLHNLTEAFESAWQAKPIQERLREIFKHIHKNPRLRLNNTRHRRRILYKNLLKRISLCQHRVWMTNAYFLPDGFLLRKIKEVAQEGADVRILLPHKTDVAFMHWAAYTFYEGLLKAGVRIYEYAPSMLHAKTLILDDWVILGSSNMNHRSLLHDLEVDVNVQAPTSKKAIESQFLADIKQAHEITLKNWPKRPLHQRILGHLVLYTKYWI